VWGGSNNFSKYSFTYIGNGTGLVKIVITSSVVTEKFAGAIDNLSIISKPDIVSAALLQGHERSISEPAILGRTVTSPVVTTSFLPITISGTTPHAAGTTSGPTAARTSSVVSSAVDAATGSSYKLSSTTDAVQGQMWQLDYADSGGRVLGSERLASTSVVSWRRADRRAVDLPTTAWVRLCGSEVFTLRDGYQLIASGRDRTLQNGWQSEIVVKNGAEAVLVTGVACSGASAVVSGYAFGVSADEPPLRDEPVEAIAFKIKLDAMGRESARKTEARTISVGEICAVPRAVELEGFCRAAETGLR
jgi:hypothetical protein